MQTCHNRKKVLFSIRTKLSYYKVFDRTVISHRNEKKQIVIDKTVYLEFPILKLSKILMYDFLRHYVKAKIWYLQKQMIFTKIAGDVETRFDTSNYELECSSIQGPLPKGKKIIGLMKDELGGKQRQNLLD